MVIPFIALLFQGIPEQVAVVTLAFVIAGIPLKWHKLIFIGIFLATFVYIVRLFPIPFGLHTILLIILLFITLVGQSKGNISLSLFASLSSFLILAVFEFLSLTLLLPIFGLTPKELDAHSFIRIIMGEPTTILLFLTAFLLIKIRQKELTP